MPTAYDLPAFTAADVQDTRNETREGDWWPLDDPDNPVQSWFRWDGKSDSIDIFYQQDVTDLIEINKAEATHNDGYSASRGIRRAARIPDGLIKKWLVEEGWDASDPANWPKLKKRLNDSDFQHLRNAPGRL